ncbi:PhoH family protein [bacterium]|nr:PhoH family protein [bacterium]
MTVRTRIKRRDEDESSVTVSTAGVDKRVLYGASGSNLRSIEAEFGVKINARGDLLTIKGRSDVIESAKEFLQSVIKHIQRGGEFSDQSFQYALRLYQKNEPLDNLDDRIIVTSSGKPIRPRTDGQREYVRAMSKSDLVIAIGPAGTGKTYLAVACAIRALKKREVDRIILVRPAVETDESLGFLPGDMKEKVDPYLRPMYDALYEMFPKGKMELYLKNNTVEVAPLAYMRGRTLNNSFIILDEAQNTTIRQMKMFLTRIGFNSKAVVNGDITQIDLKNKEDSGLACLPRILKGIKGISFVYLTEKDVARHELVQQIIKAYERFEKESAKKDKPTE